MHYYYITDYLPVRYFLTAAHNNDRQAVWNIKGGYAPACVESGRVSQVANIAGGHPSDFVVCFIPASTVEGESGIPASVIRIVVARIINHDRAA